MFRRIADFERAWQAEQQATLKVLSRLTDTSLAQRVTTGGRSLGTLAWHIAATIPEMMNRTGLAIDAPAHGPVPSTAAEIALAYERAAGALLQQVRTRWTDASLEEEVDMYGQRWTLGFALSALVAHEVHHRGQITILMRQAGLTVPGVYGPAREEWAAMGLPPAD